MTYIFDAPSLGLHPRDVGGLTSLLSRLREKGNTVLVVEHDLEAVQRADWVGDLGPGGGKDRGRVMFEGTGRELLDARGSFTAEHLRASVR
ncbi:hypothetical protein GBW32_30690 [Streptomyces tsukubensis]|uniref:UvrABC system protein A n=1 Tax=Streptomyces tsukubensis TaxID=83656 RepID=A0A1V4AEP7_9ACTN|nr:hypothetical protein B1H18_06825 [Streptomyces tsukubensis]QFR96601.1 hypothetical protein GBW32_30690 [Streptomyces tsukubensis]